MSNFQSNLEKYAELAVRVGVNIQQNQNLTINASTEAAEFVRLVVKKAYEAGARNVYVEWHDDVITRTRFELASSDALSDYPEWKARGLETLAENDGAFMSIISSDPDLLSGIDPKRIAQSTKAAGVALTKYRNYLQADKASWTVIAAASKEWAAKVFPDETPDKQIEKLWKAIFKTTRIDQEDPVETWKKHNDSLHEKVEYLNKKRYKKLHYKSTGTDLTIELHDTHTWVGAGSENEKGNFFMANMPTEEVFTVPLRNGVNGVVQSTKPLSYSGNLIDNFSLKFENGRIVSVTAEKGEEVLKQLVDTDEGSHYLGEIALVAHDSPISQSGILFYNTLFDENASNHLAIGNGYAFCVEGGKKMSREELEKVGVNSSITHVDFMIGSANMDIDGISEDGTSEAIFKNGTWAF
ncbi:aminopeptidase [Metabacillus crassostreae]|uniref:aminopeptidase n=1 Tax=Metabacillus crassostreae TaxID=929098 RepID=UPI00195CAC10|nr:aminopeptidase [Metabacillus crassostreae]MBM7603513.1 aminopeptidase [Metabacillus crassostreae]